MKKILITGGRGFIGVNLSSKLKMSHPIMTIDNLQRSSPTLISKDVDFQKVDILDYSSLESQFNNVGSIVHLAAYGSVVESIKNPFLNFNVNVQGTLNVLQAAVKSNVRRLIFASTGGALIGDAVPPVNEASLPKPISPYGASKLCGEAYCNAYAKSYNLETICLRFGNVYGPHSAHKKGAVTLFIKALLSGKPIIIYGDGSASRDYIHVDDLCSGIKEALNSNIDDGGVFHLAYGKETSVLELAKILCDIAGKPNHPIKFKPSRVGEVDRNFADFSKAKKFLKFKPKLNIRDGLAKTYEWFKSQDENIINTDTSDS